MTQSGKYEFNHWKQWFDKVWYLLMASALVTWLKYILISGNIINTDTCAKSAPKTNSVEPSEKDQKRKKCKIDKAKLGQNYVQCFLFKAFKTAFINGFVQQTTNYYII